ncbi:MAG: patatin-like phospholipase family protein [Candidatus Sedimenticola sp. 6PFRAG5]
MDKKTVSLVLGSGGARGLAHIGIIQWLNESGYRIESISGSSMGALIGGIYAAGELDTYAGWVRALEKIDVLKLVDFSFRRSGLIKGEKVIETLRDLIGDRNIEDLPISFTAVATNIDDQREVWLNQGSLFDAIRASIAIPTVFTPVEYRGKTLVDGGLVNPIPIAPTLKDKTDITIAVNLSAKADPRLANPEARQPLEQNSKGYQQRITDLVETIGAKADRKLGEALQRVDPDGSINGYQQKIHQFVDGLQQKLGLPDEEEMGIFEVVSGSIETMQNLITRFQLAAYSPDVIIDIPINSCTFYEFYRAEEMIEVGRNAAASYLERDG